MSGVVEVQIAPVVYEVNVKGGVIVKRHADQIRKRLDSGSTYDSIPTQEASGHMQVVPHDAPTVPSVAPVRKHAPAQSADEAGGNGDGQSPTVPHRESPEKSIPAVKTSVPRRSTRVKTVPKQYDDYVRTVMHIEM